MVIGVALFRITQVISYKSSIVAISLSNIVSYRH